MNLAELRDIVFNTIKKASEYGESPTDVEVSIQIDYPSGESTWSKNLDVHYDCDTQASGCVIVGSETINEESEEKQICPKCGYKFFVLHCELCGNNWAIKE